jgi:hypothetical protein
VLFSVKSTGRFSHCVTKHGASSHLTDHVQSRVSVEAVIVRKVLGIATVREPAWSCMLGNVVDYICGGCCYSHELIAGVCAVFR